MKQPRLQMRLKIKLDNKTAHGSCDSKFRVSQERK